VEVPETGGFGPGGPDEDSVTGDDGLMLTTGISASATATATTAPDSGSGSTDGPGSSGSAATAQGEDTTVGDDGANAESDGTGTSGGDTTSGTDSNSGDAPGDPLHPDLDVPGEGQVCTTPGSMVECPGIQVCRFHTTQQGLCESCDACGNLNAPCNEGTDCDILFACFQGRCTNICPLGTFYCGPVEDCLDVGHPTHGVCDPYA
jgi:hypothetical protein